MKAIDGSAGRRLRCEAARSLWRALLFFSALLTATSIDAQTTIPIGGSGGVPYRAACGPGEVLVGLVMRATPAKVPLVQWLESAYPICSKVDASGRWTGALAHYPDLRVGAWAVADPPQPSVAQAPFTRLCPSHTAVTGVQGYAGTYVDRLLLTCRPLSEAGERVSGAAVTLEMFPNTVSPAVTVSVATCGTFSFELQRGESIASLLTRVKDQIGAAAACLAPSNWTIKPVTVTPPVVLPREAGGPSKVALRECAGSRPATGLHGTAGATADPLGRAVGPMYVDSLGLTCVDEDEWRPRYHFTPERGWMNDPAGLAFANGRFQLYFQSVVDAVPVSNLTFMTKKVVWGHAHSTNLIEWTRANPVLRPAGRPVASAPFTGSAVVLESGEEPCKSNCGGGQCLAAVFTRHLIPVGPQRQAVATSCSTSPGYTAQFSGERALDLLPSIHFRDPKLVWFEDRAQGTGGFWVMVAAAGDHVQFYRSCSGAGACSGSLLTWTPLTEPPERSRYTHPDFPHLPLAVAGPFFETPDFFPLPVSNHSGSVRWVLTFAKGYIPPSAGGSKKHSESWYHVGTFDGRTFRPLGDAKRLDAGPDFYAGQTWFQGRSLPKRTIMAGWQNNWRYAHLLPTSQWKGQLSVPRELTLERTRTQPAEDFVLIQRPVSELAAKRGIRRPAAWQVRDAPLTPAGMEIDGFAQKHFEILARLQIGSLARAVQIKIRDGNAPGRLVVGWRRSSGADGQGELYIDRRNAYAGGGPVPDGFTDPIAAPMNLADGKTIDLRILVDRSSVEVFGADGRVVLSALFFPSPENTRLALEVLPDLKPAAPRTSVRPTGPVALAAASSKVISFDVYRF
jgi:fructan beta-fructosidase